MFRPRDIKQFVLDEADEMLSRGFKDQIYDVFRHLNSEIQVLKTYLRVFTFPTCFDPDLDLGLTALVFSLKLIVWVGCSLELD